MHTATTNGASMGTLTKEKLLAAMRLVEALPRALRFHIVPVQRTPRVPPLSDKILTTPAFDRAEYNRWLIEFFGYNDHSLLKPGQIIKAQIPSLFGPDETVVFIREDDYQRASHPKGVGR